MPENKFAEILKRYRDGGEEHLDVGGLQTTLNLHRGFIELLNVLAEQEAGGTKNSPSSGDDLNVHELRRFQAVLTAESLGCRSAPELLNAAHHIENYLKYGQS